MPICTVAIDNAMLGRRIATVAPVLKKIADVIDPLRIFLWWIGVQFESGGWLGEMGRVDVTGLALQRGPRWRPCRGLQVADKALPDKVGRDIWTCLRHNKRCKNIVTPQNILRVTCLITGLKISKLPATRISR